MRPSSCVLIGGGCWRLDVILDHLESNLKYWSHQRPSMKRDEAELKLLQQVRGGSATHVTARGRARTRSITLLDRDRRGISSDSRIFSGLGIGICSGIYSKSEYEYLDHSVIAVKLVAGLARIYNIFTTFLKL